MIWVAREAADGFLRSRRSRRRSRFMPFTESDRWGYTLAEAISAHDDF